MDDRLRRLLDDLDDAQRHAVMIDASPLCIKAGPGAGKTRVLTYRVAWRCGTGAADPSRTVVLTYTRAAALELRSRHAMLGLADVTTGTFQSVCLHLLARRYVDTNRRLPVVARSRQRILGDVLAAAGEKGITAGQLDAELSWAAARRVSPSGYPGAVAAAGRLLVLPSERIAELIEGYQRDKRRRGVVDLDDLQEIVLAELEADPRWVEGEQCLYRHLFVDEYQDTSLPQRRLLQILTTGRNDLCLVGDPRQSIFEFAGVAPDVMANVARDFPGTVTVELSTNHRSTARIVAVANKLIDAELSASTDEPGPAVTITGYATDREEAWAVPFLLRELGPPWGRRAVLARTNHLLDLVEAACMAAGIPTWRPQELLRRPEIRRMLGELGKLGPSTSMRAAAGDIAEIRAELLADLTRPSDEEDDDQIHVRAESPELMLARHHLDAFDELVDEYLRHRWPATVKGFLLSLEVTAGGPSAVRPVPHAVELRTIHRAKGLEWDAVILVGCEKGLLPLAGADPAEELRVAFVAVTRAATSLHCTWARQRTDRWGRVRECQPSPFLATIRAAAARIDSQPLSAEAAAGRIAGIRARLVPSQERRRPPVTRSIRIDTRIATLVDSARHAHSQNRDMRSAVIDALARQLGTDTSDLQARMGSDQGLRCLIDGVCASAIGTLDEVQHALSRS